MGLTERMMREPPRDWENAPETDTGWMRCLVGKACKEGYMHPILQRLLGTMCKVHICWLDYHFDTPIDLTRGGLGEPQPEVQYAHRTGYDMMMCRGPDGFCTDFLRQLAGQRFSERPGLARPI